MVPGRRLQKREGTRQLILSAAAKLFGEKGYAQSSVDDIAAAADIVKGTFYYNFGSKEDVVIALRHSSVQKACLEAEQMAAEGVSPLKCIEHYLVETSRWSEENPELALVLFSNGPLYVSTRPVKEGKAGSPPKPPQPPPLPVILKNLVVLAQEQGEVRCELQPAFVAALISFVSIHTHLTWAAEGMSGSPCDQVLTNFRTLLQGLGAVTEC